ncbi:helix-turn-helix domain-containing protein [Aquibaculum sediminis]|uniref:helix-turn-helix domain-containing protein n=1 Tax=Aquibaculum sediminis TaxID=3231907 RepID=UPI003452DB30
MAIQLASVSASEIDPLPAASLPQVSVSQRTDAEAGCALYGGLGLEDRRRLQSHGAPVERRAGTLVFEEGEDAANIYIVAAGVVQEYKMMPDGRRIITAFHYPGELVGLTFGARHSCSAEAATHAVLRRFSRRTLSDFNDRLPGFGQGLLSHLSDELSAVQGRQLLLGRKTAVERVASFLLELSERAARNGDSTTYLWLPMRREAIADHLGLTLETVSRVFSRLRREHLISTERNGWIELLDPEALTEIAEGD